MLRTKSGLVGMFSVLVGLAPLLLGMGTTGGKDVIQPAMDFRATVVDKDGTTVDVHRVNIGGDVQLEGDMGRGTLRIAFANIKSVEFAADSHDFSRATIHLKSGDTVTLRLRNSLTIYGQTPVGLYQIRARDLQSITFTS
jgi:hypothetical protein